MKCKEIEKSIGAQPAPGTESYDRIKAHTAACRRCRQILTFERLTVPLISAALPAEMEPTPFWINRLKNRIQELKEQRISSWEAAIVGLRGWITALGAVAVFLIAVSVQWPMAGSSGEMSRIEQEVDETALDSAEELIGNAVEPSRPPVTTHLYE